LYYAPFESIWSGTILWARRHLRVKYNLCGPIFRRNFANLLVLLGD
jgi:hypothetical protein